MTEKVGRMFTMKSIGLGIWYIASVI